MTEHTDERSFESQGPLGREALPEAGPALETSKPNAIYLKIINNARKAVAIAMVVCGAGFSLCLNRDDYFSNTLGRESGIWAWGKWAFGIGVAVCLIATLTLIIEYLARPSISKSITLRSLFTRSLFILFTIATICYSTVITLGPWQGIGVTIGAFLLIAALKKDNPARAGVAILAVIALGLPLLSTQTPYQYARRHANEIVAAGSELMDQWPKKHYIKEANINDKQVPSVLRKLGASSILVDEEHVSIYVPGYPVFTDREFIIYRIPNPTTMSDSVFIYRPSNKDTMCKINDRLWMTDY